jgi:serine protease Do
MLLVAVWGVGPAPQARADEALSSRGISAVLDKEVPETVEDLRAIQQQVRKVLKKVLPCTVGLQIQGIYGSGVIVSKDGYVLTAGHVSGKANRDAKVILQDGRILKGKTLGANHDIDSGLIKITEAGTWPYVEMGNSNDLKKGQWCVVAGHPGGFKPGRTPVVRVGRVQDNYKKFIRTDCPLVGGDSGGPVFDMDGKVVAIHSCIGTKITFNIHVPVATYRETWDRLARGDVWGQRGDGRPTGKAMLGVTGNPDEDMCRLTQVKPGGPGDRAGLQVGDIIVKCDGAAIDSISDLADEIRRKKPGDKVRLLVLRNGERLTIEAILGKNT